MLHRGFVLPHFPAHHNAGHPKTGAPARLLPACPVQCPHPLEPKVVIKVQTNGRETPMEAVKHAVKDLRDALESLRINFEENAEKARLRDHAGW